MPRRIYLNKGYAKFGGGGGGGGGERVEEGKIYSRLKTRC